MFHFFCQNQLLPIERKHYYKIFWSRLKQKWHQNICSSHLPKITEIETLRKCCRYLSGENFIWIYFCRTGDIFIAEKYCNVRHFFLEEMFSNRLVIRMYCRQFININMYHTKLQREADSERFLTENFIEISGMSDRYDLRTKLLKLFI